MNISIALAVQDKGDPRSNFGDIIAVKPAGWQWGTEELKRFLILELDLANVITDTSRAQKLTVPRFATGERWWPSSEVDPPAIVTKRRYRITQARLDTLAAANGITVDWNRVKDIADSYQPLRTISLSPIGAVRDKIGDALFTLQALQDIRDA